MLLDDPADIEMTDEGEEALEIFTARPSNPDDRLSLQAESFTKPSRPDFSSTSEDEAEEISSAEPKMLLQSDNDHSLSHKFPSKSRMLRQSIDSEDQPHEVGHADPRKYLRCIACLRNHRSCDRRLPACVHCEASKQECIYPNREKYGTNQVAMETILDPRRKSSLKPSSAENRPSTASRLSEPKNYTPLPSIVWLEGDISHSQKKCHASVIDLIRGHRRHFEETQLSGQWPIGKTVYAENGRDCVFVDEDSNEDVSVARYAYGSKKQFFVAWLPAQDASHPSVPVVCKFRVYNNESNVSRDGRIWRPLRWRTWFPNSQTYNGREVFRLVCTSTYKPKAPTKAPEAVDLHRNMKTGRKQSRPRQSYDKGMSGDDSDEPDQQRSSKRLKADRENAWKTLPKIQQQRGSNGQYAPRDMRSASYNNLLPATTTRPTTHLVREPQRKGPPLIVVFRNSSGESEGLYPYDECDTAEKLFDVACVTRIAQIEPPATRLLKVEFDGGGHGCIRPDSASDFEKIFIGELKKLMDARSSKGEMKVTISAYR